MRLASISRVGGRLRVKQGKMILRRPAKDTLTPCNLNHGDGLHFTLADGRVWELRLVSTSGEILSKCARGGDARDTGKPFGEIGSYGFRAVVEVNGRPHTLEREVGTQASFYEPWEIEGVHVWLDAVACVFREAGGFMGEKDWRHGYICQPEADARFALQEADRGICPEPVRLWCPNTAGRLDIRECYNGEDCWMGPYNGEGAHCGLDINMPRGTPLSAPVTLDEHFLFNSLEAGYNNNRWRGIRRWPDGAQWQLQCHHLDTMLRTT